MVVYTRQILTSRKPPLEFTGFYGSRLSGERRLRVVGGKPEEERPLCLVLGDVVSVVDVGSGVEADRRLAG